MSQRNEANSCSSLAVSSALLFLALWWSCLILYPQWYVQGTSSERLLAFLLSWGVILGGLGILFRLLRGISEPFLKEPFFVYRALRRLWPFLVLCFIAHLPFLSTPIATGLDAQEHAGVPAVVVSLAGDRLPVPLILLGWCGLAVFLLICTVFSRNGIGIKTLWVILVLFVGAGAAELFFLLNAGEISDPRFISRYPALGRYLFGSAYLLFGVHEWVGRLTQVVATMVAAVYVYRLGLLFFSERVGRAGAMFLLFLPPLFHYGNLNMLDCGTVMFPLVAEFYLLRYLEESRKRDFCRALLILTAGILYKRVLFFMLPVAGAQWAAHRVLLERRIVWSEMLGFLLPAGTLLLYQWLSGYNSDVPSDLRFYHLWTPEYLTAPIRMLPLSFTWPILVLVLAGAILAVRNGVQGKRWFLYGTIWFVVYILCYVLWKSPENIRQALPSYPPLIVFAAIAFDRMVGNLPCERRRSIWVIVQAYLLWVVLLLPRAEPAPDRRPIEDATWMNLTNRSSFFLPYDDMIGKMADRVPQGAVIYAPMANEPSKFYLAVHGVWNRWLWLDEPWADPPVQTPKNLEHFCRENNVSYVVLPNDRWAQLTLSRWVLDWIERNETQWLQPVEKSTWGSEYLVLYELSSE